MHKDKSNNQEFSKFLNLLFANSDFEGVIKECVFFLKNNEADSLILNYLGLSHLKLKNYLEASNVFKDAIKKDANNSYLYQNLAQAYIGAKNNFSAIKALMRCINKNNLIITAYLGAYRLLNSKSSKNKILQKMVHNINFTKIPIPADFFSFLIKNYEFKIGISICKELLKKQNNNYILHHLLGQLYFLNQELELAVLCQKKTISLKPNFYSAYYDLGEIYKTQGNLEESKNNYMLAIRNNTDIVNGELHRSFSSVYKYQTLSDSHIQQMKQYLESSNVKLEDKTQIKFALAKAYEDVKEYDLSFKLLEEANHSHYQALNYSSDFFIKEVNIFKNFHLKCKNKFSNCINLGFSEYAPIFIIGLPRSGSTLVEQIISSHSQVTSYGESKAFGHSLSNYLNVIDINLFEKQLNEVTETFFYKIGKEYCLTINNNHSYKTFTDKMLFNFCYLGLIKYSLPNAKIINCVRDYRDIYLSIYKNYFSEAKMGFSFNKRELLYFIQFFHESIQFWQKELNTHIHNLHYENLINSPKEEIKKILNFCNLSWEDECMHFYENKSQVRTVSSAQVRQNFYSSSVELWRKYESYLQEEFQKLELLMNKSV